MTQASAQDPKTLWQSQESETDPMTIEQIHALVGKYDRRTRRAMMMIPLAIAASALLLAVSWTRTPDLDVHLALGLCFAGTLITYLMAMRLLLLPRDPAESAGAFLKRRLQAQLRKAQGGWLLFLAPVVPGLVACLVVAFRRSHGVAWAPIPPLVIVAAGLGFVALRTRRQARRIRTDLDELNRLMAG